MADPWSDYTNDVITDIDASLGAKYGKVNVRKLLSNPAKYVDAPDIGSTAQKMRNDVNAYIDNALSGLSNESKALSDSLIKADAVTGQLAQNISMQAKQNRLPLVKPPVIERDTSRDVIIYVDSIDSGVTALVEKLAAESVYIADSSVAYKDHKIGGWIFGGRKTYVLRAYVPQNEVVLIESARDEINSLFDNALSMLKKR